MSLPYLLDFLFIYLFSILELQSVVWEKSNKMLPSSCGYKGAVRARAEQWRQKYNTPPDTVCQASREHLVPQNTPIVHKHMHPSFRRMQVAVINQNSPFQKEIILLVKMHA